MKKFLLFFAAGVTAVAALARTPEGQVDAYGYRMYTNASGMCGFSWVSVAGSPLAFAAPFALPGDPDPADDGGSALVLASPFEYYGTAFTSVVVSSNGYLAFAEGLDREDGRDFSNDPVASVPTYVFASGSPRFADAARVLAYHDDLRLGSGQVKGEDFPVCPRVSEALGVEPCTVVSWEGVERVASGEPLTFQVVLYHQSFEIAVQYQNVDSTGGGSATVGIQGPGARFGLAYAFDTPGTLAPSSSLCYFEPRFPPGGPIADLHVAFSPPETPPGPGPFSLPLHLGNLGPSPAADAAVSLSLSPGIAYTGDSCGGDFADGQWNLGFVPPRSGAECTLFLVNSGGGTITVAASSSAVDPDFSNNQASFEIQAADDGDGVAPEVEDSYPGGDGFPRFAKGDGNGDGIPDRNQPHVATLPLPGGKGWITVEAAGCSQLQEVATLDEAATGVPDPAWDFPLGLVRFTLPCAQAQVKLLLHQGSTPPVRYRARGIASWQDLAATRVRDRFLWGYIFELQDGGLGDMTGRDGQIRHLGGGAQPAASPGPAR